MCYSCDTSYIVWVHIQCQAFKYTLALCRGHSCRVRLAKQETLTPPGPLVSLLVDRGQWMSTVVLYCWCNSDSASVLLYLTSTLLAWKWPSTTVKHSLKYIALLDYLGLDFSVLAWKKNSRVGKIAVAALIVIKVTFVKLHVRVLHCK